MIDLSHAFHAALGDRARIQVERASAELRAGRPIAIENRGRALLAAALDGAAPSLFAAFAAMEGSTLTISEQRARVIGLDAAHPIGVPLATLSRGEALRLATVPHAGPPMSWTEAEAQATGAIQLCKEALLLPAVLTAPLAEGHEGAERIMRIALGDIAQPAGAAYALETVSEALVPLANGLTARFKVFRGGPAPRDQVAIVVGDPDPSEPVLVRAHSSCLTGDLFGSLKCDCGDQLRNAMARLADAGGGVLLYLDQEGRGIGIGAKMRAYALQSDGFDTIDADAILGFAGDERRYEYAAAMLQALGYRQVVLLTNNPEKIGALTRAGIEVVGRQPLVGRVNTHNLRYLHTKARRADHMLETLAELLDSPTGTAD